MRSLPNIALVLVDDMNVDDIRVMHRGGPNRRDADRPVVYLTFSRIWYRDTLNP